jgi:uncharacterized membrane protein
LGSKWVLRNNCIALGSHVLFSYLSYLIYQPLNKGLLSKGICVNLLTLMIALLAYFLVGIIIGKYSTKSHSYKQNIKSVCFPTVLSLVIWILCFVLDDGSFMSDIVWVLYLLYNSSLIQIYGVYVFIIGNPGNESLPAGFILLSFIPTLIIWFGMQVSQKVKLGLR